MGQTIEKMKQGNSNIRNEATAYALRYLKYIENWGRGVEKICNALEQMNPRAQNLAAERVQELARIPEYQWQKENDVE